MRSYDSRKDTMLAILGASARAAAGSAVRAGYDVSTCDLFADADLQRIAAAHRVDCYPDGFSKWLCQQECEGWLYTGGLENYPALVEKLAGQRTLWGNSAAVLREVRSPQRLAETLESAGLLFPETRNSSASLAKDGSWLRKTCRSAGGSGVQAWTERAQSTLTKDRQVFFQRRLDGKPASAVFVANCRQAQFLGATEQLIGEDWTGAEEFKYCGSVGPLLLVEKQLHTVERLGQVLAEEFKLAGLFGVDLIFEGTKVWTLEVNPRWTASVELLERAYGFNAIEIHVNACRSGELSEAVNLTTQRDGIHAKAILYAEQELLFSEELASICLSASCAEPPTMADVPVAGTLISEHHPVCTLLATGATSGEALASLRTEVEGMRSRFEPRYGAESS